MSDVDKLQPSGSALLRLRRVFCLGVGAALLSACNPTAGPGVPGARDLHLGAPVGPVEVGALTDGSEQIGNGATRIALIVPLSQASGPSQVGASLRNAAKLAFADSGVNDVTILVKDDRSSPAGAQAATQAALSEGAEIIIGPVFAGNVKEAGRLARGAGKPVIAFSTDSSAAGRGVYLLSFQVESYVERIVDYAAQRGKKSIAALVPESDYGAVALAQFQQSAANHNVRVLTIERYKPGAVQPSVQRIAQASEQIDALFIPEQAEAMVAVSRELQAAGLDTRRIQVLGTGLWNDARVLKLPAL
ncbi:MAG: ethanolamine utilization protein EutM, partial [Methylocystaceae bacterium]